MASTINAISPPFIAQLAGPCSAPVLRGALGTASDADGGWKGMIVKGLAMNVPFFRVKLR